MPSIKNKKAQNVKVIKDTEKPETPEILAASIIRISEAMQKLATQGNLTENAIAVLIKNMPNCSHLSKEDILLVLANIPKLKSYYIRK